jgi:hypothetical protein
MGKNPYLLLLKNPFLKVKSMDQKTGNPSAICVIVISGWGMPE